MATILWYMVDVIHYRFLSKSETITVNKYCNVILEILRKLSSKQPALINRKRHEEEDATKIEGLVLWALPHPSYFPYLSHTDYHLLRDLANFLKDKET